MGRMPTAGPPVSTGTGVRRGGGGLNFKPLQVFVITSVAQAGVGSLPHRVRGQFLCFSK